MSRIKQYYRIEFELSSPLSLGNGENNFSDSDVLLDNRGIPYVPGSSLAGIYRSMFAPETANLYFGAELSKSNIQQSAEVGRNFLTESKMVVYDALLMCSEKFALTIRDMVALDEYKVGIDGAKFDFQVLEPGVKFVTYLEQNIDVPGQESPKEEYLSAEIAYAWQQGQIRLGAKTGRGYGQTKTVSVTECRFDLSREDELEKWLSFDMYGDACWRTVDCAECLSSVQKDSPEYGDLSSKYRAAGISLRKKTGKNITLALQQTGGISIRQYSTDVNESDSDVSEPDYMQLILTDGTPVIPGTSWAGAFRAQMEKLDSAFSRKKKLTELFFGAVKGTDGREGHRTRVDFSESRLSGGRWTVYTRNAIDRFSGGAVDKSLYTEKTYYDGETELEIRCDFTGLDEDDITHFMQVLAAVILDLNYGYFAVGGLTSVGHGMFCVREVTVDQAAVGFSKFEPETVYRDLLAALSR